MPQSEHSIIGRPAKGRRQKQVTKFHSSSSVSVCIRGGEGGGGGRGGEGGGEGREGKMGGEERRGERGEEGGGGEERRGEGKSPVVLCLV